MGANVPSQSPYSSVAQMLRPRYSRWDVGVGESCVTTACVTKQRWIRNGLWQPIPSRGMRAREYTDSDFYAALLGIAMNTSRRIRLDVTHSDARIDGLATSHGESYRVSLQQTHGSHEYTLFQRRRLPVFNV